MRGSKGLQPRTKAETEDPVEWLPGSLGALYPRFEQHYALIADGDRRDEAQRVQEYYERTGRR